MRVTLVSIYKDVAAIFVILFVLSLIFVESGYGQLAWQVQREETLRGAEKEGKVVIYGDNTVEPVFLEAFQEKFPRLKVSMVAAPGTELAKRILTERRAGQYLADVYIPGAATPPVLLLYPAKALDPIPPLLILPEVLDQSKWWQGKHHYVDPDNQYIFLVGGSASSGSVFYNTQLVDPNQLKSLWDLLDPKWKGKIVALDPAVAGPQSRVIFLYNSPDLGPRFVGSLFRDTGITIVRSDEQLLDWLAVGKFALGLFTTASAVARAMKAGLPVKEFSPNHFKEGGYVTPSAVTVSIMNRAPHPNAAKVAINWFLSREGQSTWLKYLEKMGSTQDPLREDFPRDKALGGRREAGGKYFMTQKYDFLSNTQPINDLIKKSLAESKRQ